MDNTRESYNLPQALRPNMKKCKCKCHSEGGIQIRSTASMACLECGRGLHSECKKCRKEKCHPVAKPSEDKVLRGIGRPLSEPHEQKDPESTGRKRAAALWPIFKDEPCEWKGQKNCGGGLHPIVGCIDGKQQHRHHGPVKDTRHNEPGNVHRIDSTCHNRWHAMNNKHYDPDIYRTLPHKPEPATENELILNEQQWKQPSARRLLREEKVGGED